MKRQILTLGLGLALALPAAASAAEAVEPTLKKDVQPIFDRNCAKCHGAEEARAKLNLSAATAFKALVGTPSQQVPTLARVKPGDPGSSYLWQKVQHTAAKGKGMPKTMFGSKKLSDPDLDLIRKWIEAGAKE